MEAGTAILIVMAATVVFLVAVVVLLRRFKKVNAGKYVPATGAKRFEVRRSPQEGRPPK